MGEYQISIMLGSHEIRVSHALAVYASHVEDFGRKGGGCYVSGRWEEEGEGLRDHL